jgi:hypothetical protein
MLSLNVRSLITSGIEYLSSEYTQGRLLYKDILESRDIICATIEARERDVNRKEICDLFDKEFDHAFRSYAER